MLIDYDKHSLIINNKKVLINSAAFHYFRCPGEETWKDRLGKIKACGYNTVDIYFCWGYHSQRQGVYDFTGIRDIRRLLEIANELGLFVIARPGPFINAEVSLGGLPKWLLNIPDIIIRNKKDGDFIYSEPYMKALKEWYARIIPIINEFHNIIAFQIENEYFTNEAEPDYLQELYDMARSMGIKAPIFHNDALSVGLYSDIVNIYAFDNYPTINMCYDWKDFPDSFGVLDSAEENLGDACPNAPLFIAELQGGWFDKWGGPGYEKIHELFKKEHINIVTKTALSQGITMFNHYMACGGTCWDDIACSEVYTSYDFAAPISESGIPRENYYQAKQINYFLKAFNLASTDLINEGTGIIGEETPNIFARLRQDNINNCKWLFIRNLNKESYDLNILEKYNLSIKPTDMKILPVDLNLNACRIDFSSFEIFGRAEKNGHEIVFFVIDDNAKIVLDGGIVIKSDEVKDFSSYKFTKDNQVTEFIFLNPETADKTWIIGNKVLKGAEFVTDNSKKAYFSCDTQFKILDLDKSWEWETKEVKVSSQQLVPELKNWEVLACAPEIDLEYDYSDWNFLKEPEKFDCVANEVYDDYIWYKTSMKKLPEQIEISAKHCWAAYVNGTQIYAHDTHKFEHGHEVSETITFEVEHKLANKAGDNQVTVLAQNMGFDKGFQNELSMPRGILSFKTFPEKETEWRIRGGLTPIIEEWDIIEEENIENTSVNSYLTRFSVDFEIEQDENIYNPLFLDLEEADFNKADIFLNGIQVGRFWKTRGPQILFYLPEEFLKPDNKLSIIVWDRENNMNGHGDYKNEKMCVKIKIRNIRTFSSISI